MKKSHLRNIIKEQIKQVKQSLSREKLKVTPINYSGPLPDKKFIGTDASTLPSTYNSSAAIAFYVCAMIAGPHGYGNGCYGISPQGTWTSPVTGATASNIGCLPWHQGGNCYGGLSASDFPIQTPNGPVTRPPERACNDDCLYS